MRVGATWLVLAAIASLPLGCGSKPAPPAYSPDPTRTTLADGSKVVVRGARPEAEGWYPAKPAALWVEPRDGSAARQISFGPASVADPTVLDDGRVLFVSAMPKQPDSAETRLALFTVNNDGTGVLPFALQHDQPAGRPGVRKPWELPDGRVAFASSTSTGSGEQWEFVLSSRPFRSRAPLPPSVPKELLGPAPPARPPMGRLSTVDPKKKTGILVCLDARRNSESESPLPVTKVRLLTSAAEGTKALGEIPLATDGSFLAEVPADVPLGFESLDAEGKIVKRLSPWIWVRPGESRGCIGCHEPHGMAPRNQRPLASKALPVKCLGGAS
jgi:hypothetical protein